MSGINFSGIASGIDGNSIIQAMVDAKNLKKIPLENKISINQGESEAYKKIRELLGKLDSKSSVFQTFKGTAVSKNVVSSDEDIISGAVSGNAENGTITLRANQLAASARITYDDVFSSLSDKVAPNITAPANININVGLGTNMQSFAIEIDENTSISDLVNKINSVSNNKFYASIVNTGTELSPQYKLMMSSTETGEEKGSMGVTLDQAIIDQGVFLGSQFSQAKDSIVEVAGVGTVRRGSNVINDIFPGLSIELKQASPNPVSLKISNDIDKTTEKVSEFIAVYNELKAYLTDNDKITSTSTESGTKNSYGVLARSSVDEQLVTSLKNLFREVRIDNPNGKVSILADLGIKTNKDSGNLELDEAVFKKNLADDPQGSGRLLSSLGDKLSSANNGIIYNFTKFQGIIDSAENSNKEEDKSLNEKIIRIEANIQQQRENLTKMFARLEERIGQLQSNASALTSLITQGGSSRKR